ncbi:hypothetical protein V7124_19370 [Neobacillus niacini]|uniref:hypothetical protein n=1 Tax=Neobacillus niacini TaxID=86668 RepID=UPI002FFDFE01
MAKKASQQQLSAQTIPQEELDKLPEQEQKAIEELVAKQSGGTGKSYRLRDPNTQYTDIQSGWTLAGEQAKPLPEHYSNETWARIKAGFLIESAEGPTAQTQVTEVPQIETLKGER